MFIIGPIKSSPNLPILKDIFTRLYLCVLWKFGEQHQPLLSSYASNTENNGVRKLTLMNRVGNVYSAILQLNTMYSQNCKHIY